MADNEVKIKVTTEADTTEVENLEDVLDESKEKADDLGASISNIDGSNAGNAAGEFDELGDSADRADNEIQELQSSMDMLEAGALMGISSELSNLGDNAEGMAQEMNTAAISVGQLATQTGIAEPQMVSLVNTISNATFPQAEAMQYISVLDQLGVSGDKLGSAATDMDRINDAFGIGSTAVTNLTGNLYAMGVPADNLQTSFNALAYAQSNVVGGVDKFSTILQRLGPSFSEYGYNVDQAAVITAAATQKWGSGRKAMSELSSALKEAGNDSGALEQALGLQAGALSNASNATSQYEGQLQQLADEEAEHKTWVDQLNAAWEDFSLALSPVMSPLASVMGLIGEAGSFAVGINGLIKLGQSMRGLSLVTYAKAAADGVATAAQWLLNAAMSANPVGILIIAITALIAVLGYLYFNNEQVRAAIDGLGQTVMAVGQIIYDSLVGTLQWLSEQFQSFTDQLGLNTNDWTQAVLGFILFLPQLPLLVGQLLLDTLAQALGFGSNFTSNMINSATKAVNGFISAILGFPGWLWSILVNGINRAIQFGSNFVSSLVGGAINAVNGFSNAVQGIPRAIQSCLEWAYNIIMNHPIVQALRWLGEQAAWAFSVLGLGQSSPGKIVKSLKQELDWASEAVYDSKLPGDTAWLGESLTDSFNPELGSVGVGGAGGSSTGTGDFIVNVYGDVDNDKRVKQIVDAVKDALYWDNVTAGRDV